MAVRGKAVERWKKLRTFALALPEAYEDFPWGDRVVKVNKKIFIFMGDGGASEQQRIGIKLSEAHDFALSIPGAAPVGYGLGRAGWVSIPIGADSLSVALLREWIEESYRLVAPKRLIVKLAAR
jgi:predicted DNA-binding protein (MmcQ/YjbR family)